MSALIRIRDVLAHPKMFWATVEHEQGIAPVVKHFLAVSMLAIVGFSLMTLALSDNNLSPDAQKVVAAITSAMGMRVPVPVAIIGTSASLYAAFFIVTFVHAAIWHFFARRLGGVGSFVQTYKAFTYGATPALLFLNIPVMTLLGPPWMLLLQFTGLHMLHHFSMGKAVGVMILGDLALMALFVVPLFVLIFAGAFAA